jgi:hypothetical protein
VPILGKALARFNIRANNNTSVSDHAYMAGKSIGYAYEFRHCEPIRDLFISRFGMEWEFVKGEKLNPETVELSWNARSAGVTLANIKQKIYVDEVMSEQDFYSFCYHRYGFASSQILDLFEEVVLNVGYPDVEGALVEVMSADFI